MANARRSQVGPEPAPVDPLTVVTVQMSVASPPAERVARALAVLRAARDAVGRAVFVLPEYYLARFYPDPRRTVSAAQPVPGPSTEPFLEFAAAAGSAVVVGLLEESAVPGRPYVTAAVLGPDGVVGCYRKTHLWDLGPAREPYRECRLFTPGDALAPFDVLGWRVGVMVCADGLFPEVPRVLRLRGAELILFANSRGGVGLEVEASARANRVPIAACNAVGDNGVEECHGGSRIVGPGGRVLASVAPDEEGWASARLSLEDVRSQSAACELRLRRPTLYGPVTEEP